MKKVHAIIADDEATLRSYLRDMLHDIWPDLHISAEAKNGSEALNLIKELEPDVAFLDIKMPGLSGINVAHYANNSCRIVFITAYNEYAIKAFELEAVDYLLKPLEKSRLTKTISRLKQQLMQKNTIKQDWSRILDQLNTAAVNSENYIRWIKASKQGKVFVISIEDVCYFKAGDKYTRVVTQTKEWLIKKTLKELECELDPNVFWRIHRAAIVNMSFVVSASRTIDGRYKLQLMNQKTSLTVSRAYALQFKQM